MDTQELWQATLAQLQFHTSKAGFATWFKNTSILSQKEGELVVAVPNNFSKEWLENKYGKVIFKIIRELNGEIKEVRYVVGKPDGAVKEIVVSQHPLQQESQLELQGLKVNKATNLNPRYTFSNFIVGPFNELAHAASLGILKNPGHAYNPLFVYGGVGLGKTHLLQAVGNHFALESPQKKIRYVSSERFTSGVVSAIRNRQVDAFRGVYREIDVLIIDDVQFLAGKDKTQEELFHTFNTLYDQGKQIIFSSDRPPKAIPAIEERLRSRFEGGMIADIGHPDFETRLAILKTKAQELAAEFEEEIYEYIASHVQRNIRELEGALNRVIAFRNLHGKKPSLQEARAFLKNVIQSKSTNINPRKIIQMVAEFYDMKERDLIAASRKREVVKPRQIAMFLMRDELKCSYPFIGKKFGGKDHTTAIYACEKIAKELDESESLADELSLIKQRIYGG